MTVRDAFLVRPEQDLSWRGPAGPPPAGPRRLPHVIAASPEMLADGGSVHPKRALAFSCQEAQTTWMTDTALLLHRIDQQARRASLLGIGAFTAAILLGVGVIWGFIGQTILPWDSTGSYRTAFGNLLGNLDLATMIGRVVLHAGAIMVAVLVLRLMFGFGREQCRLASSLRMFGTLVLLSAGDAEKLRILAATLLPTYGSGLSRPPALPPH